MHHQQIVDTTINTSPTDAYDSVGTGCFRAPTVCRINILLIFLYGAPMIVSLFRCILVYHRYDEYRATPSERENTLSKRSHVLADRPCTAFENATSDTIYYHSSPD